MQGSDVQVTDCEAANVESSMEDGTAGSWKAGGMLMFVGKPAAATALNALVVLAAARIELGMTRV